ncbi:MULTISPECIES: PadR family transcriptional regulator [Mumia]|uniref:PadR family transcriptional regulator n=1 Tax=Mumia TaxID=1546255 RepID=UPI001423D996|nr:helix-turn-helix transcriptional regulator [Mumia sp. ZJ1417]QMW65629.1 helix-turn-helix transcriptional regulator [Mumia sp. ZJ1417]
MAVRRPTNALALAVLSLLAERPMHPYEMSSTLRERHKEESIRLNYGSLYSVVESLEKKGLIAARETVREGRRPERTVYEITSDGEIVMTDWLSELLSEPTPQFTDFEAALSLIATLPPDDVVPLLERRLSELTLQSRAYDAIRQALPDGFPRLFVLESDYQEAVRAAEREFVAALLADLRTETFEGISIWRRMHELRAEGADPQEAERRLVEEFPELGVLMSGP